MAFRIPGSRWFSMAARTLGYMDKALADSLWAQRAVAALLRKLRALIAAGRWL